MMIPRSSVLMLNAGTASGLPAVSECFLTTHTLTLIFSNIVTLYWYIYSN